MTDNNRPPRKTPNRSPRGAPGPRGGPERRPAPAPEPPREDARIAKIMARAGLCSRRDAETWIAAGRVAVNGATIDSPALNIHPGDRVTVDGMPLPLREETRLFLFHKPRGVVTTAKDPEGRQTVFDILPPELPRLVSVGRLDINTEGLLLLTNDGGLARVLELPSTGWLRRYRVRANGEITQPALDALSRGISIDGVDYAGIEARLDRVQGANAWLTMGLREGKNREIKRVLEHLGMAVTRLIRISFGPFQLGEISPGAIEEVRPKVLKDQLGEALAREADIIVADQPETLRHGRAQDRSTRPQGREHRPATPEPLNQPRPTRPEGSPRAHVSALRAAREEAASEGRRRTERGSTEDRKGRAVAVERVSRVSASEEQRHSRNSRRFAAEKEGGRPERADPARRTRPGSWERPAGDEPQRTREGAPGRGGARASAGRNAGPSRSGGPGHSPEEGPARSRDAKPGRSPDNRPGPNRSGGPGRSPDNRPGPNRDGKPGRENGRSFEKRSFSTKDGPTGGFQGRPTRSASPGRPGAGKPGHGGSPGRPRPSGGGRGKPRA